MWKPEGATLVEEEWKPEGAVLIEPTPKKEVTPAPTPITEALTAVEEPTEERPRFEAAPEPSIGQRIKDYFREPQMPVAYDLPEGRKYRTLPPTREEQPLRSLAELGAYGLGQYGVGRALYTPELITERPVEKLVAPISAAEPTPKEKRIGESLKFIGGLRTAGQILGPVIATFPTASQQAIIGGAGVFGLRNITEQLANWARTGKAPSLEAFAKETALGALFGTAEVGLRGFVGFVKGLGNLKKGNVSWTNIKKPQDVADAIKHFQKTGDKSKWEAIRVKYAGITEKGAARIKARAEAIPSAEAKVKEFGKFPLARAGEPVRVPVRPLRERPVARISPEVPPEGIKLPPKPTEVKIAAFKTGEAVEITTDGGKTWFKRKVASGLNPLTKKPIQPVVEIGGTVFADGKARTMVNLQGAKKGEIDSIEISKVRKPTPSAPAKPKLVDLGAAKEVKAKEQNFTQFATEHGYPSDYDITDHSQLSPSGRRTKRGEAAAMKDLQERINQNRQAHKEYREAILAGKIIDPSGKVTKEKLLVAQTEAAQKKVEGRLAQIETQIRFLSDVGKSKRGIRPSYQKQIDALRAERESLRAKPPKAPEVKAVKKVPEAEVEAKPGPAKTLETIRAEGEKKPDLLIVKPTSEPTKKIIPAKGKKILREDLEDKDKTITFTDMGGNLGVKDKSVYNIKTQKVMFDMPSSVAARKAVTTLKESGINFNRPNEEIQKVFDEWLEKNGIVPVMKKGQTDIEKAMSRGERKEAIIDFLTGRGKELELEDYLKVFPKLKKPGVEQHLNQIQSWLKGFAQTVPEFTLNPTFTFEKESGQLVFKDKYRFAVYPDYFGLDAEKWKDGQTVRFDLESFDIKKPTKAALRKAEPFLGEPKVLGRVTKKPTPSALWGELKRKPRKPTKAEEEYYKGLGDIETGVKKEVPGGITISRVTEKDVERVARLGKKAGQQAWTVEREILARGEKGLEKEAVSIEKAIKIIRNVFAVPKGKPGFVDIRPILKAHKVFMGILEPSKAVERKQGKEAYAAVIKAIHTPEVGRLEFNQAELTGIDKTIQQLGEWFEQFPDKDLRNLMASRGDPVSVNAQLIKRDAMRKLPKELRTRKVFNAIQQIANFNYKYLQKVVGDDIKRVADYFYGIYKSSKKVDKFLDYWRTTKRFTKEKKLPTVADALDYGLELRNNNPVANLRAEYVAIAHLEGMNWLQEELMRTGKGKFIDNMFDAPVEWEKVYDPIFKDLRVEPDLAKLINNLIASNKITKVPILDTVRQVNNFLRTTKFIGSAFHLLSVAKQSVADSGYLGFLYKPTALRGFTTGFRKYDPIYKTTQYKDYIRHGGGHRYSIESEARRTFTKAVNELNKNFGKAVKAGALPLRVPVTFVNWMFNSYIPKVKYSKYLDNVAETEKKLKRSLKSSEKIDIIKEQQNFYGMMNERLFGRSGTVTTAMRFYFLAPGYAEGNYRTMIKGATQWSGKRGYKANRSRSNMVNSVILTGMLATVGTMIFTGKLPKKPETVDDIRDLFKIDTGRKDNKGRQIMIDLMTYDKDYWNVAFNVLRGRPEEAIRLSVRRIGGMKAPLADMIVDLALVSLGRTVYDWKGDRVTEITDPFLRKVMKYTVHEVKKIEPIPTSVYKTARRRGIDRTVAALETLGGWRPTYSEADRREKQLLSKMYSLRGQREQLSWYIGKSTDPEGLVRKYNKTVNDILDSPYLPAEMRKNWAPKLLIDPEKAVYWKRYPSKKLSVSELRKAINKSTYKKPHKRNGVTYPIGHPHKGKEEYVKSLRAELRKRREKGMLRQ